MAASLVAWIAGVLLIAALYILGPLLYFNAASPAILGMPPLYFWFVLDPPRQPGHPRRRVYLIDQRTMAVSAPTCRSGR